MKKTRAPGWFRVFVGDEMLPNYVGIIKPHYKDPGSLLTNQYFMESNKGFVSWLK